MEETNIRTNSMKAWLLAARPKTLSGAAVPVMIGLALAYCDARFYEEGVFNWTAAVLCLLFAFAMQIDANFINDFYDYVNGADDVETRLGPRRACAQGWVKLDSMKKACFPLYDFLFLSGTGRPVGTGVLRPGACVLYLLCAVTHLQLAGVPGIGGLWLGNRCVADCE